MKKRLAMIRFLIFQCILFFFIQMSTMQVKAGELNLPEADLIEFLYGIFEYEGNVYQVKSEYITKAKNYMIQDDITLTSENKKEAISFFYDNFQVGIEEGYLELISQEAHSNQESVGGQKGSSDSTMENESDDNGIEQEHSWTNENVNQEIIDNDDGNESEDFLSDALGMIIVKEENSVIKNENSNQSEEEILSGDNNETIDGGEMNFEEEESQTVQQEASEKSMEPPVTVLDEDMIKQTGFFTTPILLLGVVFTACYIATVIFAIHMKLAAKRNEMR